MFTRALSPFHRSRILLLGVIVAGLAARRRGPEGEREGQVGEGGEVGEAHLEKAPSSSPRRDDGRRQRRSHEGRSVRRRAVAARTATSIAPALPPHRGEGHGEVGAVHVRHGRRSMKASDMKAMKPGNSGEIPANMHHYARSSTARPAVQISATALRHQLRARQGRSPHEDEVAAAVAGDPPADWALHPFSRRVSPSQGCATPPPLRDQLVRLLRAPAPRRIRRHRVRRDAPPSS